MRLDVGISIFIFVAFRAVLLNLFHTMQFMYFFFIFISFHCFIYLLCVELLKMIDVYYKHFRTYRKMHLKIFKNKK